MSVVGGVPIETLADAPQDERDRVMTLLFALLLRELFEFRLVQTDPNFANYPL
jgi:predicted unusual protein kinase regulating ubiquinone biosynthesis (AarF/ABC1/UbiB family)